VKVSVLIYKNCRLDNTNVHMRPRYTQIVQHLNMNSLSLLVLALQGATTFAQPPRYGCDISFSESVCNFDHPQCGYGPLPGLSPACQPCDFYALLEKLEAIGFGSTADYTEANCEALACCQWNGTGCMAPETPCTSSTTTSTLTATSATSSTSTLTATSAPAPTSD
jgi:hypothetical protein